MKKLNLFWLLIDSARNYETDEDDRGLPKSVVKFAEDAVFFKNVVTSAPSTIQSISSMMTSTPSYLLARSYNNYRGASDEFDYFPHILKTHGYQIFGAIYFKHGREVMSDIFGIMNKNVYPENLNHRKEIWTNNDVYNLFLQVLAKNDWQKPTMCYLHYNVRVDVNISEVIQNTIDKIEENGLMDNSVIIINSDHGYPTISRGWDPETIKKKGWGHDQQLYNDNILTPLVIKYPGCEAKKIDDFIATIDIIPSLCNIMGVQKSTKFHGINVFDPGINLVEILHRTDNRYVGQLPANISFIKGKKKCIIYKDAANNETYEYFDLDLDPGEKIPLDFESQFENLKVSIRKNNLKFKEFHINLLFDKWVRVKKIPDVNSSISICVVVESTPAFRSIIESVFSKLFPEKEIYFSPGVLTTEKPVIFDILFVIIESEIPWDFGKIGKIASQIKSRKIIYLDNNGMIIQNIV